MKKSFKYVVLEHLTMPNKGLRFWSTNTENNTHSFNGELWYKEVLFTDDTDEAVKVCQDIDDKQLPTSKDFEDYYNEDYYKNLK